jgi:hypothetical protein
MSAYSTNETQFKNKELLLQALAEMGFDASTVEVNETAQHLYGYHGDKRADTAEIIIRRKHIGSASNDIGFKLQSNGTYGAVISDYDSNRFNSAWRGKLTAAYARAGIIQTAKRQGLRFAGTIQKNGKTQLSFIR